MFFLYTIEITFRINFSSKCVKKTTTANQNPSDFKELEHLKWQTTTRRQLCFYNKQNFYLISHAHALRGVKDNKKISWQPEKFSSITFNINIDLIRSYWCRYSSWCKWAFIPGFLIGLEEKCSNSFHCLQYHSDQSDFRTKYVNSMVKTVTVDFDYSDPFFDY